MQDTKNNSLDKAGEVERSSLSSGEKISALTDILGTLNPGHYAKEIVFICDTGIGISIKNNRPEMAAQFCLIKAKAIIASGGPLIREMKDLTMAVEWFEFALETEKDLYKILDKQVRRIWQDTQATIDLGYKYINVKPYVGAVAYCHKTTGDIYGQFYLQLRLHYFILS